MCIGKVCKQFRTDLNVKLIELTNNNYKNLWSFENGRSTNINHLSLYIELAFKRGELETLYNAITNEVMNNE